MTVPIKTINFRSDIFFFLSFNPIPPINSKKAYPANLKISALDTPLSFKY